MKVTVEFENLKSLLEEARRRPAWATICEVEGTLRAIVFDQGEIKIEGLATGGAPEEAQEATTSN